MSDEKIPVWLVAFTALVGALLMAVAGGLIPASPDSFYAPRWILGLVGFVLLTTGVSLLFPAESPWRACFASVILLSMAGVGLWAAFFGDPAHISGGLPFLSEQTNVRFGKWVFGIGALITFGISGYAFKDFVIKLKKQNNAR